MSYSEKAIERLIENLSDGIYLDCYICPAYTECIVKSMPDRHVCKTEIKRVLTEWSDDE